MKDDLIKRGAIYGIPLQTDTLSLFVNTSLFQQASTEAGSEIKIPKTWQEFIDSSVAITKRDDSGAISIAGAGIGTYDNVNHAPDIISLLLIQNGVDLYNLSASKSKIADALRFYTNFTQVENNVWDSTQDFSKVAFAQGKVAMFFGYSWDLADIKKQNPGLPVKVVPVPQLVSDEKLNIGSYWAEGASLKSKHPKEAALLLKFLARRDIQEKLYAEEAKARSIGEPYSYKSLADKLKDTDSFTFVDQSNTAKSSIFISDTQNQEYNEKYNESIQKAVNDILSGESEDNAAEEILKGFNQTSTEIQSSKAK
jgi:ABC-type glycerol-3-phosphate transport system substrate-binding protein